MNFRDIPILILFTVILGAPSAHAVTENKPRIIELETLKIQGTIYEPQVLLILEQPSVDWLSTEEGKRHDFLKNLEKPLQELLSQP